MPCRSNEVGRLESLARPARILAAFVGVGLVTASLWVPAGQRGAALSLLGVGVLFVALLLPGLTDFEIDILGVHAKDRLSSRKDSLRSVCEREARAVASLVVLIGVDRDQVADLAEEAIDDTCRLWRGRVDDDLVREFVVCRAVHLVPLSLRLGAYRVLSPMPNSTDSPTMTTFAAFPAAERMIVTLVEYAEISEEQVASMLDLDRSVVVDTLRTGRAAIGRQAGGAHERWSAAR